MVAAMALRCDGCGSEHGGCGTVRELLLSARDAGWQIGARGDGDYCGVCVSEAAALDAQDVMVPKGVRA